LDSRAEHFIEHFVKELENENAAIFAGAGLSVGAGYVDWKRLLKPIANELGLDVDVEHDLVSLAQYHVNDKRNRSGLNRALIENFSEGHHVQENHQILARLPIKIFWTTNYDSLIEDALKAAGKVADVKEDVQQLKHARPKRDAIVYKMHGDIRRPDEAVLTKDDYERYPSTHGPFVTALSGDLVSKTFLFLGFSFSDPNIDYIFNRVRLSLHGQTRDHYCVFRRANQADYSEDKEYQYAAVKQEHVVRDLKRFGVQTLFVDSYSEVTDLLRRIETRYKRRTVLISGSAHEYGTWQAEEAEQFIRDLAQALIKNGNKIVSGFGLGVGSHVITGALQEIYMNEGKRLHDQLLLRPFPQGAEGMKNWEAYRRDMITYSGAALFLFGNKLADGQITNANGVRAEFDIARELGVTVVPVGATGFVAEQLWSEVINNFDAHHPGRPDLKVLFERIGPSGVRSTLIPTAIDILNKLRSH